MLGGFVKKNITMLRPTDGFIHPFFGDVKKRGRHPFQNSCNDCDVLLFFSYSQWDLYKNLRNKVLCRSPGLTVVFFLGMSDIFETILTRANFCTFRVGSNYPSNEIVVDPEIPSSKNPIRSCWLHPFAMVLALCERSTSFLGKRSVFFVLPKRFGESFFQKMGWIIWKGWKVFTPLFWFPRFTPHPFFCWVGWSGFWGEDFLGVGENPKESTVFFQPRHCGFPWYMSGENVWKIDNWNGNFDSLTNCVPYSAGAASNVVGF